MNFVETLKKELSPLHLLKHSFYEKWTKGTLPKECIKNYSAQYYHHVSAFPRYISALHSLCEDQENRQVLLENLNEEEGALGGGDPHPNLWMNFAEGLGWSAKEVKNQAPCDSIQKVIRQFFSYSRSSYAEGLSALYSYEYQVPEVAETKIQGLKTHYGITDKKTLLFFLVHKSADVEHREAIEKLLEKLPSNQRQKAVKSAVDVAQALWDFLTEMEKPPLSLSA